MLLTGTKMWLKVVSSCGAFLRGKGSNARRMSETITKKKNGPGLVARRNPKVLGTSFCKRLGQLDAAGAQWVTVPLSERKS